MNDELKFSDKIQLKSLVAFMHFLGFSYCRGEFFGSDYSGAPIVAFNTAVHMHNCEWQKNAEVNGFVPDFHAKNSVSSFSVDKYTLNKAKGAKIVKRVKLQSNKFGMIKCQSHVIAFVDEEYYQLFEGELV